MTGNCRRRCLFGLILTMVASCLLVPRLTRAHVPPERPDGRDVLTQQNRGREGAVDTSKLHPALLRLLDEEDGPIKTWVFFSDKGIDSPEAYQAAIEQVGSTYNQRAVRRRRLRGLGALQGAELFREHDLPVVERYVDAVVATGAQIHITSRWLNAVSAWATVPQIMKLAKLSRVKALQPVARSRRIDVMDVQESGSGPFPGRDSDGPRDVLNYGVSEDQLAQINLIALHEAGFTGSGVVVGILDTGFRRSHEAFNDPSHPLDVIAEYDFVDNDPNAGVDPGDPPGQHTHGTMILGCVGAYKPGALVGGAYDASFILCKTEDVTGEYPAEEDNFVAGLEFIEANGGDMATASLGYIDWYTQEDLDGQTAVTTLAVNIATSLGVHCCSAAGNDGHDVDPATSHLIAPADAFQLIACGAVNNGGVIAAFSSDGPTADGRVKPELLARGIDTHTLSPYDDTDYLTANGTSLSTPLIASAVACMIQVYPAGSVDDMRAALFLGANYYEAYGFYDPLHIRGYGIVNALVSAQDCNGNQIPDVIDIFSGTSPDCNDNGFPDECDLEGNDCNENGIPDDCDIASGTSEDRNHNGIPDECDLDPRTPEPDPMTWETPPFAVSTTAIGMTGTDATDETPPIEFFFYYPPGGDGEGGDSSGWQASRTFTDDGLDPNTIYRYSVSARDNADPRNQTEYSFPSASAATHIEIPTGLSFDNVTDTSVDVTAEGTFSNLTEGLSGLFFEMVPSEGGGADVWVQTETITVTGLTPGTEYTFRVKAQNQQGVEDDMPWTGPETQQTTGEVPCTLLGDMNGDGSVDGGDIAGFVRVKLGSPGGGDIAACANYGGSLEEDTAAFIADLLGA